MSLRAILWALDEAPVTDDTEALVLVALADQAWDDGRGAFPAVKTIARRARTSERTVQRILRHLEHWRVISKGDQSIARALVKDPRHAPCVYNLNLGLCISTGAEPIPPRTKCPHPACAPNKGSKKAADAEEAQVTRGDTSVTPPESTGDTSVTPPQSRDDTAVTSSETRGDRPGGQGVTELAPEPPLNPPPLVVDVGGKVPVHAHAREDSPPEVPPQNPSAGPADAARLHRDEHGPLSPRCPRHVDALDDPPCRECGETRREFERAEERRRDARERARTQAWIQEQNRLRGLVTPPGQHPLAAATRAMLRAAKAQGALATGTATTTEATP